MGCGILFPNDYDSEADSDQSPDDPDVSNRELDEYPSDSDSEDENMWWRQGNDEQGTKVQVGDVSSICLKWSFSNTVQQVKYQMGSLFVVLSEEERLKFFYLDQ